MNEATIPEKAATHTPGPWEVDGGIRGYDFKVIKVTVHEGPRAGQHIAIADIPEGVHDGESEANARLLAAAPDLLEELKAFEQLITGFSVDNGFHLTVVPIQIERVESVRTAIAKAEGR